MSTPKTNRVTGILGSWPNVVADITEGAPLPTLTAPGLGMEVVKLVLERGQVGGRGVAQSCGGMVWIETGQGPDGEYVVVRPDPDGTATIEVTPSNPDKLQY